MSVGGCSSGAFMVLCIFGCYVELYYNCLLFVEMSTFSIACGYNYTQAAWMGRAEIIDALLEHGADKNAQNDNGYTALMRAAMRGNARAVRIHLCLNLYGW